MVSSLVLEQPGRWRAVGTASVLLILVAPGLPLLLNTSVPLLENGELRSFGTALGNSGAVAALVAVVALLVGLPAGVLLGLYEFPLRRGILALLCLPILVPSFLWGLGWSMLGDHVQWAGVLLRLSRHIGCALVFLSGGIGLTTLTAFAATLSLSQSQIHAARLTGGEKGVFWASSRYVATPVLLVAALSGILTLSDPGPGQIVGLRTGASEILMSFAAQNDFELAGKQCLLLAFLVLIFAFPLSWLAAGRLASQVLGRQAGGPERTESKQVRPLAIGFLGGVALVTTVAPAAGLSLPLIRNTELGRAIDELARTGFNTVFYAVGAGLVAALLGLVLAICVGRDRRRRLVVVAICLAVFSLPPTLGSLGTLRVSSGAPPWSDFLLRSRVTVCAVLALRLVPVATFLLLRAWGTASASWASAAAIAGVPLGTYFRRIVWPWMLPAMGTAFLLASLLGSAEIGTVLLLAPPGEGNFPLAVFTVMANAPESFVASLCVLYLATAALVLVLVIQWASRRAAAARV